MGCVFKLFFLPEQRPSAYEEIACEEIACEEILCRAHPQSAWPDDWIAEAFELTTGGVVGIRERFCERGLQGTTSSPPAAHDADCQVSVINRFR
jgi:hypothetical protein